MLMDKSGLRKKNEMVAVKPIGEKMSDEEERANSYKTGIENINKMLQQRLITADEAADMIRIEMGRNNKK